MAEGENKKPVVLIIVPLIIVIGLIIIYFVFGVRGFFNIIKWAFIIAIIVGFIGLIVWGVYKIFIEKTKVDVTFYNKERLVKSAKLSKPPLVKDLWLSGDGKHPSMKVGYITGYAKIQAFLKPIEGKEQSKKVSDIKPQAIEQDVITFKKSKGLLGLFEDDKVLRLSEEDHTDLIGDVLVKSVSLIKIAEYFWIQQDMLDIRKVDYTIFLEGERAMGFIILADMATAVNKALGANSDHQKSLQSQNTLMIPSLPQKGTARPEQ